MVPGNYDYEWIVGTQLDEVFLAKANNLPIDNTGYTVALLFYSSPPENGGIVLLSLNSSSGITLGGNNGQITVNVGSSVLTPFMSAGNTYYRRLLMTPPGQASPDCWFQGAFIVVA